MSCLTGFNIINNKFAYQIYIFSSGKRPVSKKVNSVILVASLNNTYISYWLDKQYTYRLFSPKFLVLGPGAGAATFEAESGRAVSSPV